MLTTKSMYHCLREAATKLSVKPVSDVLKDKVCDLYLVCEKCKEINGEAYHIKSPKEKVTKFLPLAILGMSLISGVNTLGKMSKLTPEITPIIGIIIIIHILLSSSLSSSLSLSLLRLLQKLSYRVAKG